MQHYFCYKAAMLVLRSQAVMAYGLHLCDQIVKGCPCPQVGGTPAVLKYLLKHNLVDGSCLTVTGEHKPTILMLSHCSPRSSQWEQSPL